MANPLTKKTSFLLLRTNPRLTTNVKIISDSKDNIFLESFDNTGDLSKSKYKGFKVGSGGKYSFDVSKFYGNGEVPTNTAYSTFEDDDYLSAKSNFNRQYDFKYNYGSYVKTSRLYKEEFACFAPLWIEPNNIPDYFVIFKTKDPVSVSTLNVTDPTDSSVLASVDSSQFFDNIIKNSDILKTVDLTERSNIGKYIRSHAKDTTFPESPLSVKWNAGDNSTWNGISYKDGGFVRISNDVTKTMLIEDKTIREFENFMTNGFQRNGVICANILNMEFLFDDIEEEDFKINRYWGAYVTEAEIGRFQLNSTKLFNRKNLELSQVPQPKVDGNIGSKNNTEEQIQTNPNGIKMYFDLVDGHTIKPSYVSDYPLFGYVKDKNNQLYSVKNGVTWNSDELRLDTKKVDWADFTGFDKAKNFISADILTEITGSHCILTISGPPPNGCEIRIKNTGYKKGFIGDSGNLQSGFTAHNNSDSTIDSYTIDANPSLSPRDFDYGRFSNQGENYKIAESIAGAINLIKKSNGERESFIAKNVGNKVIIISTTPSETLNELTLSIFGSSNTNIAIDESNASYENVTDYLESPVSSATPSSGVLLVTNFIGANSVIGNKVRISSDDVDQFNTERYLKTDKGYSKIKTISDYLDIKFDKYGYVDEFIDFGKYKVIEVEDKDHTVSLNSSKKCSVYDLSDFSMGFVSFYPIKDFDNNLFSEEYGRDADGYPEELSTSISNYLKDTASPTPPGFTSINSVGFSIMDLTIGASSSFVINEGFNTLRDIIDERDGSFAKISNEYDRLNENELVNLAIPSKVIPFINKWVYDDGGEDVRSNPYRLTSSESFGFSDFTPSHKHFGRDPKFFTHEWYLLQKYPFYFDLEQKKNSFSYFDEELDIADLYRVDEDKFLDYFTVSSIGATVNIPTQLRYSIFSEGSDTRFPETFFRGCKVLIKEREENTTTINYNLSNLKFKQSTKFNGYRFSSILTFNDSNNAEIKVIKNDKYKNITFITSIDIQDPYYTALGHASPSPSSDRFIERSLLYTMEDAYTYPNIGEFDYAGKIVKNYSNIVVDGDVKITLSTGTVTGSQNGTFSNYKRDLNQLEDGTYGEFVIFAGNSKIYIIEGIYDVQVNSFKFQKIIETTSYDITTGTIGGSPADYYAGDTDTAPFTILSNWNSSLGASYQYRGGGIGKYKKLIEYASFANIAELINKGDPSIQYISVDSTGATSTNDFILELLEPEYVNKVTYLNPVNDDNRPVSLTITSEIGSGLEPLRRTYIQPISRFDGNYSPKFNDVITFTQRRVDLYNTLYTDFGNDDDKRDLLLTNTVFDYEHPDFGKIKNLYYNKVNEENPKSILEVSSLSGFQAKYPKINEIAIDSKDFYTFLSNWDPGYFDVYEDKSKKTPTIGTRSMTEKRSFFGSKVMSLPDEIYLETFRKGSLTDIGDLTLIDNFELDVIESKDFVDTNPRSIGNSRSQNKIYLDSFIDIALTKWLLDNGVGSVFNEFVNPLLSFGSSTSLDDDKIEYIKKNILNRYYIDEITFWEQRFKSNPGNLPEVDLTLSDTLKLNNEYSISKNYRVRRNDNNDLRFRLIYNIGKNDEFSISMSVKLKKK